MAERLAVVIDGEPYDLALDGELLTSGKPVITRKLRDAEPSDPGRLKNAYWPTVGPMGQSREDASVMAVTYGTGLGIDYGVNVDHRFALTNAPERTAFDLSAFDGDTEEFDLGDPLGGALGTPSAVGNVTAIDEDRGRLFFARGARAAQVDPATMTLEDTVDLGAAARGSARWRGKGVYALGPSVAMKRRLTVAAGGSTYAPVVATNPAGDVYARAVIAKSRICAYVNADGKIQFTADDFATLSNAFQVIDTENAPTGMGRLGPYLYVGHERGVASFTDAGDPVEYLRQLVDDPDALNGSQQAEQWGWNYVVTVRGLYAVRGAEYARVGLESFVGFEGPLRGVPYAVKAVGDDLLVSIWTGSDSHAIRGRYNANVTPVSGVPDWYTYRTYPGVEVAAFGSTGLRGDPIVIIGEGLDASWCPASRQAREISDPAYRFAAEVGQLFGSTMMRSPGMLKYPRAWRFFARQLAGNSVEILQLNDEGINTAGAYVSVGSATVDGQQEIRPVDANGAPVAALAFYRTKPQVALHNTSATTPPIVEGPLELLYDERPSQVEEASMTLVLGQRPGTKPATQRARLQALAGRSAPEPRTIRLPGATTDSYGFVNAVQEAPLKPGIDGVQVVLSLW